MCNSINILDLLKQKLLRFIISQNDYVFYLLHLMSVIYTLKMSYFSFCWNTVCFHGTFFSSELKSHFPLASTSFWKSLVLHIPLQIESIFLFVPQQAVPGKENFHQKVCKRLASCQKKADATPLSYLAQSNFPNRFYCAHPAFRL
jgi:hypothetical protein